MSNNKQLKNVVNDKHWGSLAHGFLKLAEQGFNYLNSQKNIGKQKMSFGRLMYRLDVGSLVVASIWNIKHGLELAVKGLGTNFNKQYWNNHDLQFLFKDLKNRIINFSLERDIMVLEKLITKYHGCKFYTKTYFDDMNNNFFKYPEIENGSLDYSFVHDISKKDIIQFLKDIYNIRRVYDLLEAELQHHKCYWSIHKKEADKFLLTVATMKKPGYKK